MSENKGKPTADTSEPPPSWRQAVPQKYRSKQVNDIANALALLEPGATPASKLMLASQFENKMFNEASSLNDCHKRIQKRLKRMQKNYRKSNPPAAPVPADETSNSRHRRPQLTDREVQAEKETIARLKRSILLRHGDRLRLIVSNGHATTKVITEQHGFDKGERFAQHVDCALQWALDVGAVPDDGTVMKRNGTVVCWGTNWRSLEEERMGLEKTGKDLDSRLKNIWYYVLKWTKIDLFVLERLKEVEEELMHASSENDGLSEGNTKSNCASFLAKRILAIMKKEGIDLMAPSEYGVEAIQKYLDKIRSVVPIPRGAQEEKEACLLYLDKIRHACQVLLIYITLDYKDNVDGKNARIELNGSIEKAYNGAIDAFNFLAERYKEVDVRPKGNTSDVMLEDAWNKCMEYDKDVSIEEDENGGSVDESEVDMLGRKRQSVAIDGAISEKKRRILPLVIQSRVLLSPQRNPPSHLVTALKYKGAEICRDESYAATTLKMQFGNAFEMQIYFSPLLVTIRALPIKVEDEKLGLGADNQNKKSKFRENIVDAGLASWKSPYIGLNRSITKNQYNYEHNTASLRVMGISGDSSTLAPLVAKHLEYASAQATRVLRRCFADIAGKAYNSKTSSDFEVELLEGTAVLKFVTNARSTYTPNWGKQ